jgi:hypothetical protein
MARVSDYVIIRDSLLRLNTQLTHSQPNETQSFQFNMPAGFHRGSRCILMFTIQPGSGSAEFRIFLNGQTTEYHGIFGDGGFFSMHEVVTANVLNQNNNTIQFALDNSVPNNRVIDFGDVVLLCQVEA